MATDNLKNLADFLFPSLEQTALVVLAEDAFARGVFQHPGAIQFLWFRH